ncbi:MAG: hypothetical protein OWQ48_03655 [Desulfurococcus sp.]|nr:hypothetical protein [Desulfurococcus sp.]
MPPALPQVLEEARNTVHDTVNSIVEAVKLYKETLDDGVLGYFMKLFNKYLEYIGPLPYIPGLVEKLGEEVVLTLWDVDFDYKALERLMILLYEAKSSLEDKASLESMESMLNEIAVLLSYLMAKTGVSLAKLGGFRGLLGSDSRQVDPLSMITIALVFLIIATNP